MRKSQLLINSLLLVLLCCVTMQIDASNKRKKKKKRTATYTKSNAVQQSDSLRIVPAPGVVNKNAFDSIKRERMKLKRQADASHLVVSFISHAAGIDAKAFSEFESIIKKFKKQNGCTFNYVLKSWGREGERDYCVTSSYPECMNSFLVELNKRLKGNSRVLIQEKTFCRE
jgi:hypothetical protein